MNAAPPNGPELARVVFTDLDDSLFSTRRKHADHEELVPTATLRNGDVISYSNARQRSLLAWLTAGATLVPVTARSHGGYRRVSVRFSSWAIVSHGATVLMPDGSVDPQWREQIRPHLAAGVPALRDLIEQVHGGVAGVDACHARLLEDDGEGIYFVAKHPGGNAAAVRDLHDRLVAGWVARNPGYCLHLNDNNLAVLPPGVRKSLAVRYVAERLRETMGPFLTLGLGDSHTDADFMLDCDYALLPTRSQLATRIRES
ncbi:haloacid dehalogenase [Solimonas sp. K1W22B-7]|uniref:haloacid dehalogenase n=1 Tax=Solimonas sp. K1W22B-7 TaxID=2303331 RepID=UPI000E337CA6|nr:haloacid dehalogenase [Solimonas sp. K1W22B-7]AXQ27490.1 haloacid dehalogenase [Solimonas sp. K1W22B-7]